MKKLAIATFFILTAPLVISAHEVKRAGTLEILLHREPQESPIAREPAELYFAVTDSQGRFAYADCACQVTVTLGAETLVDRPLTAADEAPDWGEDVVAVPFVFPGLGVYQARLAGQSKTGSFNDFDLTYDVRVERESAVPAPQGNDMSEESGLLRNYYLIGGAVLVCGIIINELISKRRKNHS